MSDTGRGRIERRGQARQDRAAKAIVDKRAMQRLFDDLRIAGTRAGYSKMKIETGLSKLSAPLLLIDRLYRLSLAVLVNPTAAARRTLRVTMCELAATVPGFAGSRQALAARSLTVSPADRWDCNLIDGDVLPTIYLGAVMAAFDEPNSLPQLFNVVAGLSLRHSALETFEATRFHDGIDGLTRDLRITHAIGELGGSGYTPDPDGGGGFPPMPGPGGGGGFPPMPGPGGGGGFPPMPGPGGGGGFPPMPGPPSPPTRPCIGIREACEDMLLDALEQETGVAPTINQIVWAHNITSIELEGACAGNKMIVRGSGFGAVKPASVELVMEVAGVCQPVATDSWTNTAIEVTLPANVAPGPVGFVDTAMLDAYNRWIDRTNARMRQMATANKCLGIGPLDLPPLPNMGFPCPPNLDVNYVLVGLPVIHAFHAEVGADDVLEPGENFALQWSVENAASIRLARVSGAGPLFGGNPAIDNPPGTTWDFGPATHDVRRVYQYELRATNSCGTVVQAVAVQAVSQTPTLSVEAIEITQGIQTMFHTAGSPHPDDLPDNAVRLVGQKDTLVRVYVSSMRPDWPTNVAEVTGVLVVDGNLIAPIQSQIDAKPMAEINRWERDDTLNFLVPGAVARGTPNITAYVTWTEDGRSRTVTGGRSITFYERRVVPVRYVRLGAGKVDPPSDADARHTVERGFDYLPSAPLDIAPASKAVHRSHHDGESDWSQWRLFSSLNDEKHCSLWEWGDDCDRPDENLIWVGVTDANIRGIAPCCIGYDCDLALVRTYPVGALGDDRSRVNCGHEIGHLFKLGHVEGYGAPSCFCCGCDELPQDGVISDACFDIYRNLIVPEVGGKVVDFMSYYDYEALWVSNKNWTRLFWNIGG